MNIYVSNQAREKYNRNLISFAHVKEALQLADKIIFATSARLLDPYANTTEETRNNLLTRYPLIQHGQLKRVFLANLTDIGYSPQKDKDILLISLLQHQIKPLEPYLHTNNQAKIIQEDLANINNSISHEPADGFELIYNSDCTIPNNFQAAFDAKLEMIEEELPVIHLLKHEFEKLGHIERMSQVGFIFLSPTFMIDAAIKAKIITRDEGIAFLEKQNALINLEIEAALKRKVKDDRRTTTILRLYESLISEYLKGQKS